MKKNRFLITGGGGFLGKALGKTLVAQGHEVISVGRGSYPELASCGISHHRLDIAKDEEALTKLLSGVGGVFHVAAKVEMWGAWDEFYSANVLGTRAVMNACEKARVRNIVFTNSPSVVASGVDLNCVDESTPYPSHYEAFYPETKALAEKEILEAGKSGRLKTISLRPHLIFGPGDTSLTATVLEKAQAGRLVRIGEGKNLSDFTYIDDCVSAHILAMAALEEGRCSGNAYFITQGDPVPLWGWIDRILAVHGMPPIKRSLPFGVAKVVAGIAEGICKFLPFGIEPPFTRFLVTEMATSHYFNIAAAKKDLGYTPSCTVWEGIERYAKAV